MTWAVDAARRVGAGAPLTGSNSETWNARAALKKLRAFPRAEIADVLRRRIYAPLAYAPVRNAAVVPIVHSECLTLASWFPLVWQRRQATVEFVAIRALLNDQRAQPPAARALLPLLLHAYPFVFDTERGRFMLYNGGRYGAGGFGIAVLDQD